MTKISDAWFYRLKAAQRDLIAANGGIQKSADRTSTSKSEVGRWNNPGDPDIMTLPAALTLEAEAGIPLVTAVMAELNGRRLADPDAERDSSGCFMRRSSELSLAYAGFESAKASAYADNDITPAEAATLDQRASVMEREVSEIRKLLAGLRGRDEA